jgi:hypothetical protein
VAVAFARGALGVAPLPAVAAGAGIALGFGALLKGGDRWALLGLLALSATQGLWYPASFRYHGIRAGMLVALGVVAVPLLRIAARRPVLKQRLGLAFACAAIFSFGFFGFF